MHPSIAGIMQRKNPDANNVATNQEILKIIAFSVGMGVIRFIYVLHSLGPRCA